jgi:hypothetical protein
MNCHPLLKKYHDAAKASFREDWCDLAKVRAIAQQAGLGEMFCSLLEEFLLWADEEVKQFMWLFYYLQFCGEEDFYANIWELDTIPMPKEAEERFPGCMKSVVYLLSWLNLDRWVRERGLPEEISQAYFKQYRYLSSLNEISHGTPALCRLSPFLYGYSRPVSLRLGRLNYQLLPFKNYCELYRDEEGNRLFAALPNYRYDANGCQAAEGWIPTYRKEGEVLVAHTFRKDGRLNSEPERIDLLRYRRILSPEDDVITVHIPEGGRLELSQVKESLAMAKDVYGKYFPQAKAIVCQTWFIDPNLRGPVIRDGSNMAVFADLFDVICGPDNEYHSIYEHVFKVKKQPLADLTPRNSLQERILRYALDGRKMYWGFGVLKELH